MARRKLALPLSGRYPSGTKREFVSRAANPASFTGTKFIQPPLACRHPLSACGPASHFYKGLVSDLGSSPCLMRWAFRSPVRIGNEVTSAGWKTTSLPLLGLPAPIPTLNETQKQTYLEMRISRRKGRWLAWLLCAGHQGSSCSTFPHPIHLLTSYPRTAAFPHLADVSNRIRRGGRIREKILPCARQHPGYLIS